jgi:hypothetical protein
VNCHLVILKKPYLELILSGRKTIELRLTRSKHPAFGRVRPGDRLFLKISSGPVCATATVAHVEYYENLTPPRIADIQRRYNNQIMGGDAVWQAKMDCRYGFLVWPTEVRRIEPIRINKKDWRAWVVLVRGKDFGLLAGARSERTGDGPAPP